VDFKEEREYGTSIQSAMQSDSIIASSLLVRKSCSLSGTRARSASRSATSLGQGPRGMYVRHAEHITARRRRAGVGSRCRFNWTGWLPSTVTSWSAYGYPRNATILPVFGAVQYVAQASISLRRRTGRRAGRPLRPCSRSHGQLPPRTPRSGKLVHSAAQSLNAE